MTCTPTPLVKPMSISLRLSCLGAVIECTAPFWPTESSSIVLCIVLFLGYKLAKTNICVNAFCECIGDKPGDACYDQPMQKSGEDYLEAVLALSEDHGKVRTTDVALRLGVSKPSVNRAMKVLSQEGFVNQETYGDIHLTEKGKIKAAQVYFRHKTLTSFLQDVLGVDPTVAEQDACLIEHDISTETMEKLASFLQAQKQDSR